MKKIKFLLFVLLALLYVTNASALIVNDTFGSVLKPSCKPILLSA